MSANDIKPTTATRTAWIKARMGWAAPRCETTADFNADFDVTGGFGLNAFLREGDTIYRTCFTNDRGVESLGSVWSFLDITPYVGKRRGKTRPLAHHRARRTSGGGCMMNTASTRRTAAGTDPPVDFTAGACRCDCPSFFVNMFNPRRKPHARNE